MLFRLPKHKRNQIKGVRDAANLLRAHRTELARRQSEIPDDVFEVTDFVLRENADLFDSIATLYKQGHFRSCIVLARSLLENAVNLQYIYRDKTETRAKNFKLYSLKSYVGRADAVDDFPGKDKLISSLKKLTQEHSPEGNNEYHWNGQSFKKICSEMSFNSIYQSIYTRLSEYTHSSYMRELNYEDTGPYTLFLKRFVFTDTVVITGQLLKDINQRFDLLVGFMHFPDYPEINSDFFFSFSNTKHEDKL